jgi:hypothetical protein
VTFSPHHFQNTLKYENEEIVFVATLKLPVATCGEWRQGWTTLFYNIVVAHQKSLKLATEFTVHAKFASLKFSYIQQSHSPIFHFQANFKNYV